MSRDELVHIAQAIVKQASKKYGTAPAMRIVVAVSDESGEWVGVASTTHHEDCIGVLASALTGAQMKLHHDVIDVEAEP